MDHGRPGRGGAEEPSERLVEDPRAARVLNEALARLLEEQRGPDAEGGAGGDAGEDHVPNGRDVTSNRAHGNLEGVAGGAWAW